MKSINLNTTKIMENKIRGKMMEGEVNIYNYVKNFSDIVTNPQNLSIFLEIAKNKTKKLSELQKDLKIDIYQLIPKIELLQKTGFIEENPHPDDIDKVFKLAFGGQLFAEQLKNSYPSIKDYLGEESLIETLEINRQI